MMKCNKISLFLFSVLLLFFAIPIKSFVISSSIFPFQSPCIPSPSTHHPSLLFVACNDHHLYSIYKGNFTTSWSRNLNGRLQTSPTLRASDLLVGTEGGQLYRLDQASGDIHWTIHLEGGYIMTSPLFLSNDYLVVASGSILYLLEVSSGEPIAVYHHKSPVSANLAFYKGLLAVPSIDGSISLFQFLGEDGFEPKWTFETEHQIDFQSAPVFVPSLESLLVGGYSNKLQLLSLDTGEPKWEITMGDVVASPTLSKEENHILVGSSDGTLSCLASHSGKIQWKASLNAPIQAPPLLLEDSFKDRYGGIVLVGTSGKGLHIYAFRTGELLTTFKHKTASARSWILSQPQLLDYTNPKEEKEEIDINRELLHSQTIVYTSTDGALVSIHLKEDIHLKDEL